MTLHPLTGTVQEQRQTYANKGIEQPEGIIMDMFMDDRMTTYLHGVKPIPGNFHQAHHLECQQMEHEDGEGMVATPGKPAPHPAPMTGQPDGNHTTEKESGQCGQRQRQATDQI